MPQEDLVPVSLTLHVPPDIADMIGRGDITYKVELISKDLPKHPDLRSMVPDALDAYAALCAEGPYCNISAAGTERLRVVCVGFATLIRAADEMLGMFNLRAWARITIVVMASFNITTAGDCVLDPSTENDIITMLEDDLRDASALFQAEAERIQALGAAPAEST